jgi:hypothetical protein
MKFLEEDKYKYIIDQMVILFFRYVLKRLKNECYKETKYCYQILAADIMIETRLYY